MWRQAALKIIFLKIFILFYKCQKEIHSFIISILPLSKAPKKYPEINCQLLKESGRSDPHITNSQLPGDMIRCRRRWKATVKSYRENTDTYIILSRDNSRHGPSFSTSPACDMLIRDTGK